MELQNILMCCWLSDGLLVVGGVGFFDENMGSWVGRSEFIAVARGRRAGTTSRVVVTTRRVRAGLSDRDVLVEISSWMLDMSTPS